MVYQVRIFISISKELQDFCYERLGDNSGSIVVLDVRNGEVLSMVSKPSLILMIY